MTLIKYATQLFILVILIALAGCVNTRKYNEVKLKKGVNYYKLESKPGSGEPFTPDTIVYTVTKAGEGHLAQVQEKGDSILKVTPTVGRYTSKDYKIVQGDITNATFEKLKSIAGDYGPVEVFPSHLQEFQTRRGDALVFDTIPIPQLKVVSQKKNLKKSASFRYVEQRPVFQVLTIPFKHRMRPNDTIPPQMMRSFNIGFGIGQKFTFRNFTQRYRGSQWLNSTHSSFSITPGGFFGTTLISLENGVSVKNPVDQSKGVFGLSAGAYLVAGVDKFNVGFAVGIDRAVDKDRREWVYRDRPLWYGLVLSFDLSDN